MFHINNSFIYVIIKEIIEIILGNTIINYTGA